MVAGNKDLRDKRHNELDKLATYITSEKERSKCVIPEVMTDGKDEDDYCNLSDSCIPKSWSEFKAHILSIETDSENFAMKVINRPPSAEHQRTMDEFRRQLAARTRNTLGTPSMSRQESRQGSRHSSRPGSATGLRNGRATPLKETIEENDDFWPEDGDEVDQTRDDSSSSSEEKCNNNRRKIHHGWMVLRNAVDDIGRSMKKRKKSGWQLLSKTMTYMSDKDGAREQIYDRYLKHPDWWQEGFQLPFNSTVVKKLNELNRAQQRSRPVTAGSKHSSSRPATASATSSRSRRLDSAFETSERTLNKSHSRDLRPRSSYL